MAHYAWQQSGAGAYEAVEAARKEGLVAALEPREMEDWLCVLKEMLQWPTREICRVTVYESVKPAHQFLNSSLLNIAHSANCARKFNLRSHRHRNAWRLKPVIHSRGADFAFREPTPFKVHLALLTGMW
jgi:hypothetical protein